MKQIFTVLALISLKCSVATIQQKDVLIYDGESYDLKNYYLEEYFECYPEKRPNGGIISSDLWRGYSALFVILEKQLYLVDLQIRIQDTNSEDFFITKWVSVFNNFSPDCDEFLVDWVDDFIILATGDVVDYERGFGISFDSYSLLQIENGLEISAKSFSLKFFKKHFKKCHLFFRHEDFILLNEKLSNERN